MFSSHCDRDRRAAGSGSAARPCYRSSLLRAPGRLKSTSRHVDCAPLTFNHSKMRGVVPVVDADATYYSRHRSRISTEDHGPRHPDGPMNVRTSRMRSRVPLRCAPDPQLLLHGPGLRRRAVTPQGGWRGGPPRAGAVRGRQPVVAVVGDEVVGPGARVEDSPFRPATLRSGKPRCAVASSRREAVGGGGSARGPEPHRSTQDRRRRSPVLQDGSPGNSSAPGESDERAASTGRSRPFGAKATTGGRTRNGERPSALAGAVVSKHSFDLEPT